MDDFSIRVVKEWRLAELELTVAQFDIAIGDVVSNGTIEEKQDYINIILRTAGKSIVTMREIVCLSKNGFPDGALSLARNIYEQMIIIMFFIIKANDPDIDSFVSDYFLNSEIERLKKHKYELEIRDESDQINSEQKEIDALKTKATRKVSGNYWWSGFGSFSNLSDYVIKNANPIITKLLQLMHSGYNRACVALHANCLGNALRLGTESGFTGVNTLPRLTGHELPLWLATSSFITIVGEACSALEIDDTFNKSLNDLAIFYVRKMHIETADDH